MAASVNVVLSCRYMKENVITDRTKWIQVVNVEIYFTFCQKHSFLETSSKTETKSQSDNLGKNHQNSCRGALYAPLTP